MRGVIIGSAGRGRGLDDPDFEPIWKAAADAGLFVFIHPHYGIGHGLFPDTGHALMLALGFTFETSIAVALLMGGVDGIPIRMISYGGSRYNISVLVPTVHKKVTLQAISDKVLNG
jgi:hypothetical protein